MSWAGEIFHPVNKFQTVHRGWTIRNQSRSDNIPFKPLFKKKKKKRNLKRTEHAISEYNTFFKRCSPSWSDSDSDDSNDDDIGSMTAWPGSPLLVMSPLEIARDARVRQRTRIRSLSTGSRRHYDDDDDCDSIPRWLFDRPRLTRPHTRTVHTQSRKTRPAMAAVEGVGGVALHPALPPHHVSGKDRRD